MDQLSMVDLFGLIDFTGGHSNNFIHIHVYHHVMTDTSQPNNQFISHNIGKRCFSCFTKQMFEKVFLCLAKKALHIQNSRIISKPKVYIQKNLRCRRASLNKSKIKFLPCFKDSFVLLSAGLGMHCRCKAVSHTLLIK